MLDNTKSNAFRLTLLALMVLQNSSVVLIGRYTRSSVSDDELYNVNQLILVAEVCKFIGASILEARGTDIIASVNVHVIQHPLDFLRILIPAGLYLVQNTLLYVALSNLSAPMFQVTYQMKLLTTAVVSVILLGRRYILKQWIALISLGIGVAIVILSESDTSKSNSEGSFATGLFAVVVACFSSAMAGVYTEMILKNKINPTPDASTSSKPAASLWMRNMQMAFFSIVIALIKGLWEGNNENENKPMLHGFTFWVWVLIALQAGGGLLVAAIIKYADNVLKGLATGVAVAFSTLCSTVLFGTPLTVHFLFGATIILSSVYMFSTAKAPPSSSDNAKGGKDGGSSEMKQMLPK